MTLLPSITPRTWSREIHAFKLCLDSSSFCSAISCQEEINPRCFEDLGSLDKRLQRQSMDIPFPAVITLFMFHSDYAVSLNRSSTALLPFTISQVSSDGWEYPDHIVPCNDSQWRLHWPMLGYEWMDACELSVVRHNLLYLLCIQC